MPRIFCALLVAAVAIAVAGLARAAEPDDDSALSAADVASWSLAACERSGAKDHVSFTCAGEFAAGVVETSGSPRSVLANPAPVLWKLGVPPHFSMQPMTFEDWREQRYAGVDIVGRDGDGNAISIGKVIAVPVGKHVRVAMCISNGATLHHKCQWALPSLADFGVKWFSRRTRSTMRLAFGRQAIAMPAGCRVQADSDDSVNLLCRDTLRLRRESATQTAADALNEFASLLERELPAKRLSEHACTVGGVAASCVELADRSSGVRIVIGSAVFDGVSYVASCFERRGDVELGPACAAAIRF